MFFCLNGFTLVELLIVVAIMVILMSLSIPLFRSFQKETDLVDVSEKIINVLRLAQNKTLASEQDDNWGVFFATSTSPHQAILFKGKSFDSRDIAFDEVYQLPSSTEVYQLNLNNGGKEIIFDRLTSTTNNFGSIVLQSAVLSFKEKNIFIGKYGQISLEEPLVPSDAELLTDSRHVHFNYNRHIDIVDESIILTFTYNELTFSREIIIAEHIKGGQIYWQGEIDLEESIEKIKIHTHRLNDPDSQFCIHRDRRYNNKALQIELSGDLSGTLIEYSSDGLVTNYTSIYVSELQWQ